jgi:L-threonylcarbamoyladenylate synthase
MKIGKDIAQAARLLSSGEAVAIPTETVYGLAANALNPDAILKIFEIKQRPLFDPLIVHIGQKEQLSALTTHIPAILEKLIDAFWPGPLTVLLPKTALVPDLCTSGLPHAAFRMPEHPLTLALLNELPFPLAAPSANPFGYISPTSAEHVYKQLGETIPYILDGGPCTVGLESTIVSAFDEKAIYIHRLGGLSIEALAAHADIAGIQEHSSSTPSAPGMLESHYAPRKPLYFGELNTLFEQHSAERMAILSFSNAYATDRPHLILSPSADMHEAARNLFAHMRELDASDCDFILAEPAPEVGLGKAINDRLTRASVRK